MELGVILFAVLFAAILKTSHTYQHRTKREEIVDKKGRADGKSKRKDN